MDNNNYATHWQYFRNFSIQSLCHFLILNNEEHSIFQKNRWCKLIKAYSLNTYWKDYEKADVLFSEIIEDPMTDLFIYERNLIYQQSLINKVQFVNKSSLPKAEKFHRVEEAAVKVFPKIKELELCNNPLARTIKELDSQMQLPIDRNYLYKTFGACK